MLRMLRFSSSYISCLVTEVGWKSLEVELTFSEGVTPVSKFGQSGRREDVLAPSGCVLGRIAPFCGLKEFLATGILLTPSVIPPSCPDRCDRSNVGNSIMTSQRISRCKPRNDDHQKHWDYSVLPSYPPEGSFRILAASGG